ncbi:MAG: hypothetical protein ACYC8T_02320 [Myxococcaceae bacterium]
MVLQLIALAALAQTPGKAPMRVEQGRVGAVYASPLQKGGHELRIVFPGTVRPDLEGSYEEALKHTEPVAIDGDLVIFDGKGVIARVSSQPAILRFWCENDGGMQYRPELNVTLPASALKRKLAPQGRLQNLAAFALVVPKGGKNFKAPGVAWRTTDYERVMDGDANGDGKPDAVIYVAPDDAGNCDGKPENNLTIHLLAGDRWDELRCCGP